MQVVNRMRGGGKHRNKKAEKKTAASPKGQEPERGQQQHDEEKIKQSLMRRKDMRKMK